MTLLVAYVVTVAFAVGGWYSYQMEYLIVIGTANFRDACGSYMFQTCVTINSTRGWVTVITQLRNITVGKSTYILKAFYSLGSKMLNDWSELIEVCYSYYLAYIYSSLKDMWWCVLQTRICIYVNIMLLYKLCQKIFANERTCSTMQWHFN